MKVAIVYPELMKTIYIVDKSSYVLYPICMGYFGKLQEKIIAQKLRKKGLSYGEIQKHVDVSKDSISRWCKDIELTDFQKQRLINKRLDGQKRGSIVAADNKRHRRIVETEKIMIKTREELGPLSKRDKFVVGIALYAAEGNKTSSNAGFTNSDPKAVKFMTSWFLDYAMVPSEKLRGSIWLHEGLNEKQAINFWSKTTGIPTNHFYKTYRAKVKDHSKKIRKNIHQFGVFSVRFSNVIIQRRILGWISALLDDKIDKHIETKV